VYMNSAAPVYIVNSNMKVFNDTHTDNFCHEVLSNMKLCLQRCADNKRVFSVNPHIFESVDINKCEEIRKFKNELTATNTFIEIKKPLMNPRSRYSIEYVVNNRLLVLDDFREGPSE
jgi:hypothetical protein